MPILQAHQLSYQFADGKSLFNDVSVTLRHKRVGLVGRNGSGKSVLADVLSGERRPTSGYVKVTKKVHTYHQLPSSLLNSDLTIAGYLNLEPQLHALAQIESGKCDQHWFDLVAEQWSLKYDLQNQLLALGLPSDVHFPCAKLSGGQLAKLQLWQLFQSDAQLLVLDEPSNHLDQAGRMWLRDQLRQFYGYVVLVSHDRLLLREMDQIWQLSSLGLTQYGGNYDHYYAQQQQHAAAIERQLDSVHKQQKALQRQAQRNKEKADQRTAQGMKVRRSGSQPKILLNGLRDKATSAVAHRNKNELGRSACLQQKVQALTARQARDQTQKFYMHDAIQKRGPLISLVNAVLPFGQCEPIHFQLGHGDKLWLKGDNGSGKSTLLNVIRAKQTLKGGRCLVNAPVYYLDQHFALLAPELSMLEAFHQRCATIPASEARTLLAGIGFRRDDVHRKVAHLSGGEKMKLAMLIVSHQDSAPILLLDEPDNHLDLDSKILLARTLASYPGAVMMVSHDSDFAEQSGVTLSYQLSS
ncbi:ATP-binding cassette domain-containing protein [Vibrio sinaloensis]|uniref:ATP-binding cassette domain-containing protein n=1 Tax=Photobacterium sp. (strain ATCC 43367) TaxID=379097 RepID=UPI0020653F4C|nr:ATP-binding cassette domain-containing protein [Vibrio sinaloensis]UPQ90269.1 ATP-binding cassette domain-containing protein [Vibrio sinaloensis]